MAKANKNPLGKARRSIWFVLRAVLIISAVLGLAYAVFTEAMYISNMFIVTTEGMEQRADTVLENGSISELKQYFTDGFLEHDELLNSGAYLDYAVDSYDYRYDIKGISVMPWSKTGTVTYIERIPTIRGSAVSDEVQGPVTPWIPMHYKVNLVKIEGRWLIDSLVVVEENPPEEVRPTPDYSLIEGTQKP